MDLKKTDSSSAMQSLAMYDADSDEEQNVSKEEEIRKDTENEVDNISDDEEDHHIGSAKSNTKRPHSPSPKSASSVEIQEPPKRDKKAMRLVSYATDDMDDEEARLTSSDDEEEEGDDDDDDGTIKDLKKVQGLDYSKSLDSELASSLSRQVRHMSSDEISLPPEPPGKCSKQLQDKITRSYHKMRTTGLDLNESIQRRKDFRNPSIYEKLIEHCGIDEKGTNYPPDIYDPHFWGKESFYDELAKVQKVEMDKREKEKKDRTKIEFLSGTKKGVVESGDKRKTKWDSTNNKNVSISSMSVTTSASGNKPIVISAMGTIKKEKK
ncbi:unnamed protein product [Owenia fusiformis]|uniref:Uncharacterized protein n=1 Tax=Owenia fusiformis TaxID=6347 RepID=A0A8J1TZH0_OWEFU|nr:unnamed protein product [Owenia fusiformis]